MKKIVLIIDDTKKDVELLRKYFEPEYEVLPKQNELNEYFEAFRDSVKLKSYIEEIVQQHYHDLRLIVSDLFFDGDFKGNFDGIDLIRYIREMRLEGIREQYFEFIPIIATSRVSDDYNYLRMAYEVKATLYIDKEVKDKNDKIIGLSTMGKQLINPFDDWCDKSGLGRYKVGFSFTGLDKSNMEYHRAFVKDIAESLSRRCGISVFFDEFYDAITNTQNGEELAKIYHSQCDKIVVLLSNEYNDPNSNVWTSEEWQSGIKPYINETSCDNLCLLNVSDNLNKNGVLSKMFKEITPNFNNKTNTQRWDRIYKDIFEQREYFYELTQSKRSAKSSFEEYFSTFKKEKLKTIVDFIINRFGFSEIVPN